MNVVRQFWKRLGERYAALSRREKMMIAVAVVGAPLLIGQSLLIDPQLAGIRGLERGIAQKSSSAAELQAQVGVLQQQLQTDPDAAAKADLAALKAEQERVDGELTQLGSTLVRPEEMNGLLERLLARHAGLRLLSLKNLSPRGILGEGEGRTEKKDSAKADVRQFDLYRHGVEIRLEGSYADLQAYLAQLEQMQQRLLWGQLQYRVVDYPRAEMSLTVYTLSPDRTWLAL